MVGLACRRRGRGRRRRAEAVTVRPLALVGVVGLVAVVAARSRASTSRGARVVQLSESDALAFYVDTLRAMGMPATFNRLRFLSAWRVAEGGRASWNPFNTTWSGGASSRYNHVGVRNYPNRAAGLAATVGTLRLRYYVDLRDRLQRDDPAEVIASSPNLRTWGTGGGVARVLQASPGPIAYSAPMFAEAV